MIDTDTQNLIVSASPLSRPLVIRYPKTTRLLTIFGRNPNVLPVHAVTRRMTCGSHAIIDTQWLATAALFLRRPLNNRYPEPRRLRFTFEQAMPPTIPTGISLAHHSRKEQQCSTCTRGFAEDDLRQPTASRYPLRDRCLFNSCGKPYVNRYPNPLRLPLLFLGEPTYLRYPWKRRSLIFLEPTNNGALPNYCPLAPLVFSANQTSHDTH